jgi:hypothetical protein
MLSQVQKIKKLMNLYLNVSPSLCPFIYIYNEFEHQKQNEINFKK